MVGLKTKNVFKWVVEDMEGVTNNDFRDAIFFRYNLDLEKQKVILILTTNNNHNVKFFPEMIHNFVILCN